ncbi:MAG: type II toxin-antitoxin system HicA family toxin [Chloroflexi bacterium]|nr:type II toxin-antitoxin system HicA family toxin [Chloroflexota bacterium]
MAERLPRVTRIEALRALRRGGWVQVTQVGSHVHLKHPSKPGRVTVPIHKGRTLSADLLSSILKQAGMTVDEFRSLL